MKSAYFFENWADYVKLLDDQKRLTFFDTFVKVCFEGVIPSAADGDAFMFYCLIRPAVEERDLRAKLSASGVKARQIKRFKTAVDTAVDTYKRREENRIEENIRNESESGARPRTRTRKSHLKSQVSSAAHDNDSLIVAQAPIVSPPPTADDVKIAAHNIGVDEWFREYFVSEMSKVGWVEHSRKNDGSTRPVTKANLALVLRAWWEAEKKNPRARETPVTSPVAESPIPVATMEIV